MDEKQLAALFERLGARNPAEWANSEVKEDIPQLARFLFLRQAWRQVVQAPNVEWLAEGLSRPTAAPGGGIADALKRVLALGADPKDLTEIVRVKQWELLFALCYLLDDPTLGEPEVKDLSWGLFEVSLVGIPQRRISGLHESVLETEPTGREMRS